GAGNDTLEGGADNDILFGDDGDDTATYRNALAAITANLGDSTENNGEAEGDTYDGIENLEGGKFADTLTGDGSANRLKGGARNDQLFGGLGADNLEGGAGADKLDGGGGIDAATYAGASAGVTVYLDPANAAKNKGDAAGDSFISIDNLIGSDFN